MKIKKALCLILASACLAAAGCTPAVQDKYYEYDYTPVHASQDRTLAFYSSDEDLAHVLNDYTERHMRYNEQTQIHNFPVGAGRSDWKEWEAMAGSFWDSSAAYGTLPSEYATKDLVTDWLRAPNLDAQGYVMPDGGGANSWGLGWEFPSHQSSGGLYYGFDSDAAGWQAAAGTYLSVNDSRLTARTVNGERIEITSPDISRTAMGMPFVQIGFYLSLTDRSAVDDLYIYYKTASDNSWSEDKKAAFSTFCLQGFSLEYGSEYDLVEGFFPMYLLEGWGRDREEITGLKVVVQADEGKTISGNIAIDWIGGEYDDRHVLNNCNYIIAAKEILSFSQDAALLAEVMPNARRAMNYLYYQLKGESGLISTEYLVGHDNRGSQVNFGLGDGYWDVSSFPDVNIYCNISYYNAIRAMKYLENMCAEYGVNAGAAYTQNENLDGRCRYELTEESLGELAQLCKTRFEEYFWNERTGRFHAGVRSTNGSLQDNGYLMFNQQAIAAGLGTEEQRASIMSWINGERAVQGDNSTGEDIYFYEFAPRFCTVELTPDVFWSGVGMFGTNVNNGGTALHLTYYDLVSQARTDVNRAGERLNAFVEWYKKVEAAGGSGWNFYRDYYLPTGISLQGGGQGGQIGLDYEFLEAAIVIRAIPDAFFSLEPLEGKTLGVAPNLPDGLHYIRMENLTYGGRYYDLSAGHYFAALSGVSACGTPVSGLKVQFTFEEPDFAFKVYADGEETNDYTLSGGKLTVTADFADIMIEIRKVTE